MLEMQKKLTRGFYVALSLPATAMGFALCVQIAALSWILSTKYGLDIHQVGIVWAAGPLAGIVGQVVIGLWSDKAWFWGGRRRPFIIVGGTLAALMLVALPNLDRIQSALGAQSIMGVAIVVALTLDLAINVSFNPTRSLIADVTTAGAARTRGYTWMQTISGSFGVGAYVLGALAGNEALIYFGAGFVLLTSIVPALLVSESRDLTEGAASPDAETKGATQTGQLMRIYIAHAFTWLGVQTMFVYIFAYISQMLFGITDNALLNPTQSETIGKTIALAFMVLNTVGFILPALVLEPLAAKIGRVRTHLGCVAIMAVGYFGVMLVGKTALSLYVLMGVIGIGWASVVSLPFAIMSEYVDKTRMGLFMGVFNLSVVLPQLVVSFFLGSVVQGAADKGVIFLICGVSLAISAALWGVVRESKSAASEDAPLAVATH